jgi:tRNA pseudouridine55 synthase
LAGAVDGDKKGNTSSRMSDILGFHLSDLTKYVGRFTQSYPAFSSKTVNGKQLHELARADGLPEEMPTKEVEIYSIELLEDTRINAKELKTRIFNAIDKVNGDFRQETIKKQWDGVLTDPAREFRMIKIRVKCSSGTYMRSLAHRMGRDAGTGAFAISIKRTGIGGM